MNIKAIFSVFFILFLCSAAFSQNNPVQVTVTDTENLPLPKAPVILTNAADSSVVHSITGLNGIAIFENLAEGVYLINISYMGFQPIESTILITDELRQFDYIMSTDAISLEGVTITARRPFIRQEDDKMIIDPEPIANTSTNALEILESTPGLYVDQEGGIYLTGATPAAVYINGREMKMSTQDINTILRSLPPHSVDRIEVLKTPSSKFDASSSGGIINIVLKKGVKIGRFGSVSSGMNQGEYGNRFAGFSFNNSSDKTTSYLNFNYNYNQRFEELNTLRTLRTDTFLQQTSESLANSNQIYTGYGLNYEPKSNISFSYDGRINASTRQSDADNQNRIQTSEETILSNSNNTILNFSDFINIQQDLGMLLKTDTLGSELDVRLSYSYNINSSDQEYSTSYITPFSAELSGSGKNNQGRHFLVLQTDLTQHLPLGVKIETGVKGSLMNYDSDSKYFINLNGNNVTDASRTNAFLYKENIYAAYAQASKKLFAGFNLKAGVRLEHTSMNGLQKVPTDTGFVINRTDWFPYVYLSRKVLDLMGIELFGYMIYRRTISRPGYQQLNPYIRFVDEFLYETGNPSLTPQFNENIELNISYNDMPVFAVGRNYTKDIFSMVMYRDEDYEGVLMRTYDNLGTSRETYFRGMAGIPPGGKYFFAIGAQYHYNEYEGVYDNEPLSFSNGSWRFFTFHSLNLTKETKLTASGFMMTKGVWNFYELNTFGQVNLGLSQTFFNKKLTITLNARDIFRTMINDFTFSQGSIVTTGNRYTDNRRFGINIRYNFGIREKEDRRGMPAFEEPEF
jgi:iron complex outermembrane recepter protein